MIPITRVCGAELSYCADRRSVSPRRTGKPGAVENVVICTGPGSCIIGVGISPPQVGKDVNRRPPQLRSVSSS